MSIPTGTRTTAPLRMGMISTYPPTECGLATFTAALAHHVAELPGVTDVGVVRVVDRPRPRPAPEVVAELVEGSATSTRDVLAVLSRYDVAVLQHEYGIFGGPDGRDVLDLVDGLDVPLVTVLHTVLERPSASQREILLRVVDASAHVVTMTWTAHDRLLSVTAPTPPRCRSSRTAPPTTGRSGRWSAPA